MLLLEETEGTIYTQPIMIVLSLVGLLIPHDGGLPVAQIFLRQIVVSLLGISFVISVLICTYLTPENFLLMLLMLYVRTVCLPIHKLFFSYYVFNLLTL